MAHVPASQALARFHRTSIPTGAYRTALLLFAALAISLPTAADDAAEVNAAIRALSDPDANVRRDAASALWGKEKAAAPAREALVKALDDPSPAVAIRAAGALQSLGMGEAQLAPARQRVFEAPAAGREDRFMAARGLVGRVPAARLVVPVIEYLDEYPKGNNADSSRRTLERLARTGERAILPPLTEALRRSVKPNAKVILMATIRVFEPRADDVAMWAPVVAMSLRDADSSVRNEALWTLGKAGGLAAAQAEAVVALLSDPEASLRKRAAETLGEMGDPSQAITAGAKAGVAQRARPALARLESDPDAEVREAARAALARMGGESALAADKAGPGEGEAMAALRDRKVKVDPGSAFQALMMLDVPTVRALLDAGLPPTASVAGNGPPLYVALQWAPMSCSPAVRPTKTETKAMVKLLIERGANANGADANGNTPLMAAAGHGCDREVLHALIAAGAKTDAVNRNGLTAFEMGLAFGHDGLEEILAAGYRLPAQKAKALEQTYAANPASLALVRKAARK